jgi:hypothetical protein
LNYAPSRVLTSEEKDLVWKYRFYLARDKRGLTKFVKSVTWRDPMEVKQAVEELLPMWTEIDTDDALELLGPGTVDSRVRAFAVKQLARADDDVCFPIVQRLFFPLTVFRSSCYIYCNSSNPSSSRALPATQGRRVRQRALFRMMTAVSQTSWSPAP